MELDKMIELITAEVIKKLQGIKEEEELLTTKKLLVLEQGEFSSIFEDCNLLKYKLDTLDDFNKRDLEEYDAIIITNLDNQKLSNLALGIQDGLITELVIKAMLLGKEIYAIKKGVEYLIYKETANQNFYKLLEEYHQKLVDFGINFIKEEELFNYLDDSQAEEVNQIVKEEKEDLNGKEEFILSKKLITADIVEDLYRQGYSELIVSTTSILTPLASDYIRTNKIEIIRE